MGTREIFPPDDDEDWPRGRALSIDVHTVPPMGQPAPLPIPNDATGALAQILERLNQTTAQAGHADQMGAKTVAEFERHRMHMNKLYGLCSELADRIAQVQGFLVNKDDPEQGLIKRMERVETWKARHAGMIAAYSSVGAGALGLVAWLANIVISHWH